MAIHTGHPRSGDPAGAAAVRPLFKVVTPPTTSAPPLAGAEALALPGCREKDERHRGKHLFDMKRCLMSDKDDAQTASRRRQRS